MTIKLYTWGLWILSFSLVTGVLLSVAVDLNRAHLFNPAWPGHARFNDAAMLNLLGGVSAVALLHLWCKAPVPVTNENDATCLMI